MDTFLWIIVIFTELKSDQPFGRYDRKRKHNAAIALAMNYFYRTRDDDVHDKHFFNGHYYVLRRIFRTADPISIL